MFGLISKDMNTIDTEGFDAYRIFLLSLLVIFLMGCSKDEFVSERNWLNAQFVEIPSATIKIDDNNYSQKVNITQWADAIIFFKNTNQTTRVFY